MYCLDTDAAVERIQDWYATRGRMCQYHPTAAPKRIKSATLSFGVRILESYNISGITKSDLTLYFGLRIL